MENQPHTPDQITLPEAQSANESNPAEFSGTPESQEQNDYQTLHMTEAEPADHKEELVAVPNKHGKTQFLIKGKNAETGFKYSRFASKDEVNDALGAFNEPAKEKRENKNLFIGERDDQSRPKHLAAGGPNEVNPDYAPKHLKAPIEIPAENQAVYDRIDAEAAEGKVEDLRKPGESASEAMDRFFEEKGLKTPQLKTDAELDAKHPDPYDNPVLRGRNDEKFWAELNKREGKNTSQEYEPKHMKEKKFARLRNFGRKAMVLFGLTSDPNQGPTIQPPNRREAAPEVENAERAPQDVELPKPVERSEAPRHDVPTEVRINAERAVEEDEDEKAA